MLGELRFGVIGLGAMGSAVAASLLARGFEVVGHDIDPSRLGPLEGLGLEPAPSPSAVVAATMASCSLLPSAAALRDVVDDIVAASDRHGDGPVVLAELSTLDVGDKEAARDRLSPAGVILLDGALSGTAVQARNGDLAVYAAGDRGAFDACRPAFDAFGRASHFLGAFGAATRTKLIANHLVSVHIAAAAEALLMARRAGLDLEATLAALVDGAGTSRMLEVRGPLMVSGVYEPPWMRMTLFLKDLALIEGLADEVGAPVPLFDATAAAFRAAVAAGIGQLDTAALHTWLSTRDGDPGPA